MTCCDTSDHVDVAADIKRQRIAASIPSEGFAQIDSRGGSIFIVARLPVNMRMITMAGFMRKRPGFAFQRIRESAWE
jgi:hypothetical protein